MGKVRAAALFKRSIAMKRKLIVAMVTSTVLATLLIGSGVLNAADKSIKWNTDFKKAAKAAKRQQKPMMLDFYTEWCGWCKRLDKDTYTDSRVIDLSDKFISVKIDGDKDPALVKQYRVEGYPTIVFTNSKGKEINRVVGYRNADDFLKVMQEALKANK
jgi:thiol:disulfide interchange protein